MDKYYYFRDVSNFDELLKKSMDKSRLSNNQQETVIIKEIELKANQFNSFLKNFNRSYDFLMPYIDEMKIENGIWKSILVSNSDEGILVMSNGYNYPRFVAIYENWHRLGGLKDE